MDSFINRLAISLIFLLLFSGSVHAQEKEEELADFSIEKLLNVEVVSASRFTESVRETPAAMVVVSRRDIENRGYTSLTQVFEDLPGFDVIRAQGDVYQLVYARGNRTGSFNERTMLLVNGVEHNMLYTQHMQIDHDFPISAIERIEVLYGPASAVYGANAFSGVINIITVDPTHLKRGETKIRGQFGMGTNSTKYGDVTIAGRSGNLGFSVSYRRYLSDRVDQTWGKGYFKEGSIIGNPDLWGPYAELYPKWNNGTDSHAVIGRLTFRNFELGYNRLLNKNGNGGVYPYDKCMASDDWVFRREVYYIKHRAEITDKIAWNILGTYQKGGSAPDSVWGQGWNKDNNNLNSERTVELLTWKYLAEKWSLINDIVFNVSRNVTLSGGVKFAAGRYQKAYHFGRSDRIVFMPGDREYDYERLYPVTFTDSIDPGRSYKDSEWGIYMQAKWKAFDDRVIFVLGARYDDNNFYGDTFNPRVGVVYRFSDKFMLKANYGSAYHPPAPRNVGGSWEGLDVSSSLKPDKIKTFDLNFTWQTENLVHDLTLFRNVVANSILQGENLPEKRMYGAEFKLTYFRKEISNAITDLNIHLNYTYTHSRFDEKIVSEETGRSSAWVGGIAKHKFNLLGSMMLFKRVNVNVSLNYVGDRPTVVSNPVSEVDSFLVTGIGIELKSLIKSMSLFINIENLFNTRYYHPGYDNAGAGEDLSVPSRTWFSSRFPQDGRVFTAGFKIEL